MPIDPNTVEGSMDFLYETIIPSILYNSVPLGKYVFLLENITNVKPIITQYGGGKTYYIPFKAISLTNRVVFGGIHCYDEINIDIPYQTFFNAVTKFPRRGLIKGKRYGALILLERRNKTASSLHYFDPVIEGSDILTIITKFNEWLKEHPEHLDMKVPGKPLGEGVIYEP